MSWYAFISNSSRYLKMVCVAEKNKFVDCAVIRSWTRSFLVSVIYRGLLFYSDAFCVYVLASEKFPEKTSLGVLYSPAGSWETSAAKRGGADSWAQAAHSEELIHLDGPAPPSLTSVSVWPGREAADISK